MCEFEGRVEFSSKVDENNNFCTGAEGSPGADLGNDAGVCLKQIAFNKTNKRTCIAGAHMGTHNSIFVWKFAGPHLLLNILLINISLKVPTAPPKMYSRLPMYVR